MPPRKWKRKTSRIIIQENANISSNQKSYTKLIAKESKITPLGFKKKVIQQNFEKIKQNMKKRKMKIFSITMIQN